MIEGFKKPSLFIDVDQSNQLFDKGIDTQFKQMESDDEEDNENSDSYVTPSKPVHNLRQLAIDNQLSTPQPMKPSLNQSESSPSSRSNNAKSESEQEAFNFDYTGINKDQYSVQSGFDQDAQVDYEEYKENNDHYITHMAASDMNVQRA